MRLEPWPDVVLSVLGTQGLIFSERQQRVYSVNRSAVFIWSQLWDEGLSTHETALRLSQLTGLDEAEAEQITNRCLRDWTALGLIGSSNELAALAEDGEVRTSVKTSGCLSLERCHSIDFLECAGLQVAVGYPNALVAASVRAIAGHLRVFGAVEPDLSIEIQGLADRYRIVAPGFEGCTATDPDGVAVQFKQALTEAILENDRDAIAVHAAAVLSPKGAVVLAGVSGSGKTTLAAVLNAGGWPCIADDIVIFRTGRIKVTGLPLAFATKTRTWDVLLGAYPKLNDLPARVRPDGRIVRYIPPTVCADRRRDFDLCCVVLVNYSENKAEAALPSEKSEALALLLNDARNSARRLTSTAFMTAAALVRQATCLRLEHSDPYTAGAQLQSILACSKADSP